MGKLFTKTILDLTDQDLSQLNEASKREFDVLLPPRDKMADRYFFLLKDGEKILAMGQLLPIEPMIFKEKKFSVLGIGGIVAQEKGKGYGREIMTAIRKFLLGQKETGIGFCKLKNKGFYEKCGFLTDTNSLKRFIYKQDNFSADKENECIFYIDNDDRFMEKVLESDSEVVLPIPPVW